MQQASGELRRLSKAAATAHIHEEILNHRISQRANIHDFPRPGEPYTTPAIEEAARAAEDIQRASLDPEPIGISEEQEEAAAKLIDMAVVKNGHRPLPATEHEKYEQLCQDLYSGMDLPDKDLAWMKRYEHWLSTGERITY
jgi:hypothetical protein